MYGDQQAIIRVMRTKAGEPLTDSSIKDIKRICRLGFYHDIKMLMDLKDGRSILVVQVVENHLFEP